MGMMVLCGLCLCGLELGLELRKRGLASFCIGWIVMWHVALLVLSFLLSLIGSLYAAGKQRSPSCWLDMARATHTYFFVALFLLLLLHPLWII